MSNPAQGADGAETMTAGQVAFEAFCNGPQAAQAWSAGPDAGRQPWERVAAAVLKHAALATPRTDSAEVTAGKAADLIRAAASAAFEHGWAVADPASEPNGEPEKATAALKAALAAVATPAPSSPGVPDSVRALSEAASPDWDTNEATPYILGPQIDGEVDRFEVIARGPHGHAKSGDAIREWQANRMFAVAAVNWVRSLLSAHPAGQGEQHILRAVVEVYPNRTDTRLTFGDRIRPEPSIKAVEQAIAALTAEYQARGGCPVVGRHPAGKSTGQGAEDEAVWPEQYGRLADGYGPIEEWRDWTIRSGLEPMSNAALHALRGMIGEFVSDAIKNALQSAPDSPLTGPVGVEGLRAAMIRALDGHTTYSRDCHLSGDFLCQQVWPLVEAALAARPAAPEAQGAWQDISTAPKDGTKLLLCVAGYEPCIGGWFEKRWLSFDPESFDHETLTKWLEDTTYEPTHWRPRPAPPSSGQGGR